MNILRHFTNGLLSGTTMSSGGASTGGSLSMGAGGEVTQQGQSSMDVASGEITKGSGSMTIQPGDAPLTQAEQEALLRGETLPDKPDETAEEKTAREAKEAEAAAAKGKEPAKKAEGAEDEKPALTAEEQTAKDLSDAEEMIKAGTLPDNLKDLDAPTIAKFAPFTREFQATGDLSPESIKAAATAFGQPEGIVKQWVAGQKAEAALAAAQTKVPTTEERIAALTPAEKTAYDAKVNAVLDVAGGRAGYDAFLGWANEGGLTKDELTELATAAEVSPRAAKAVMTEFYGRYTEQGGGKGPRDLSRGPGGKPNTETVEGFATVDEQNTAIRDPRFAKDAKYRAGVEARMVATKGFV